MRGHKDMPDEIRLGHRRVKIQQMDTPGGHDAILGQAFVSRGLININLDTHEQEADLLNTLIHEMLHHMWSLYSMDEGSLTEERVVDSLANGLSEALVRNPELARWIQRQAARSASQ